MTKAIRKASLVFLAFFTMTVNSLQAQESTTDNKTTFSVETDPLTFVYKGYAFHIRIQPKNSKHVVVGAGTYALDIPGFMVDMNTENKNKGWNVRINSAVSLFGEYYFKKANHKWFAGIQTGIQQYKNTNDQEPGQESKYSNVLIMPLVGYNWRPFKNGFYVKPWLGIGYTAKISGDNSIDGLTYDISPMTSFITVHIGYTF